MYTTSASKQELNELFPVEAGTVINAKGNSNIIYIYCPIDKIDMITMVMKRDRINYKLNDYSVKNFKGNVICHYRSTEFTPEENAFLIAATASGAKVQPLVSFLEHKLGHIETELLHPHYFLHKKAFYILSSSYNRFIKRCIDLIAICLLAIIALPIGLLTAILIRLESPGPIFFKQLRVGKFNQEFEVIKFRSMRNDAEKNGAQWAEKNDVRVTKVGKFIRKTRIDELPQLLNVFRGDMSLVGPRPEREVFIKELEKEIPYYRFRHAVKPGVTGLAQVKYAYGASVEDAIWKHKYDMYYIKHQNLWLDIKIILLTFKTVIFGMGR